MSQEPNRSSGSLRPSLLARLAKRGAASALVAGAGASAWYLCRSAQPEEPARERPDLQVSSVSTAPSGSDLQGNQRQLPKSKPDSRLSPDIYGWAAQVHTKVSGSLEDATPSTSGRRSAAQIARQNQEEVAVLRALVKQRNLRRLPARLKNNEAELIRYAIACGVFRAKSAEERSSALERAAESVEATAKWLKQYHFLSKEDMRPYANMVWWEDLDAENRPILMIRLGKALNECKTKAEADKVADVIISQIEYGVCNFLSDKEEAAEKLVVVLDCRGTTAFKATKAVRLMKTVAKTLNQHYPSRLHQLFFVEPPTVMKWPIQAAKPLLHADTGNKISICPVTDPALPVDITQIPRSW